MKTQKAQSSVVSPFMERVEPEAKPKVVRRVLSPDGPGSPSVVYEKIEGPTRTVRMPPDGPGDPGGVEYTVPARKPHERNRFESDMIRG